MPPVSTENRFHQFTRTIGHCWLPRELSIALNEHAEPDDLSDSIETFRRLSGQDGKGVKSTLVSRLESSLLTHLVRHTPTCHQRTIGEWNLTTDVDQVPHSLGRHIGGDRAWGLWQGISEVKKRLCGTWALRGHVQRIPFQGMRRILTMSDNGKIKS